MYMHFGGPEFPGVAFIVEKARVGVKDDGTT